MAEGMNKWIGLGNLGADAELSYTQGGTAVLSFRLACTTGYVDRDNQRKETTTWAPCVMFGKRGEALVRSLTKGTTLLVEGELRIESYEKNGEKRYAPKIHVRDLWFAGGRGRAESEPAAPQPQRNPAAAQYDTSGDADFYGKTGDDIPF